MRRIFSSVALFLLFFLVWTRPAAAQQGPDLSDLVVSWASGSWRSPINCEFEGTLRRGVRRIVIEPNLIPGRPAGLKLRFVDLHPGEATRCIDLRGKAQPNLLGGVKARLPGRPHPETARRDFRQTLKRKKGFELDIIEGTIKVEAVGSDAAEYERLDFSGGTLRISVVYPATDEARELASFNSDRKFILTLKTKSGETIQLPVFTPEAR